MESSKIDDIYARQLTFTSQPQTISWSNFQSNFGPPKFNKQAQSPSEKTDEESITKKSSRPTKRTTFTVHQISMLELEFSKNEYICKDRRGELARSIDLSECQVKTWFQNRRTKKRRFISPVKITNTPKEIHPDYQPYWPYALPIHK
ncbi:unnamed protein product [Caenorhabditis bovis]|uniref:Homeobox domain-containing protein n=1 Tax=Caenorhabditis bovis TaxID=2654633 RepID=A0A8S1EBL1_9PELO|nr:unnamed protein product [Caenorhabditis bovis]